MDSVDPVKKAFTSHEQLLQALCEASQHMAAQVTELKGHMSHLTCTLHHHLQPQLVTSESQLVTEAHIGDPEPFDTNCDKCRGFLLQCSLVSYNQANRVSGSIPVSPEPLDLAHVPTIYHNLQEVFSKEQARSRLPHRPYDSSIDLLPGNPLPSSQLYNLLHSEREALEQYLTDSLAAGTIRFSSPLGAGFFFVAKDKMLRPCIDFQGLNDIAVKNEYPQ